MIAFLSQEPGYTLIINENKQVLDPDILWYERKSFFHTGLFSSRGPYQSFRSRLL